MMSVRESCLWLDTSSWNFSFHTGCRVVLAMVLCSLRCGLRYSLHAAWPTCEPGPDLVQSVGRGLAQRYIPSRLLLESLETVGGSSISHQLYGLSLTASPPVEDVMWSRQL